MVMSRKETMVQLTDQLREQLDAEASRRGISRSVLIREAVASYLAESREAEIDRQIVEGYTRIPPGTVDEWGDLEAQMDATALDVEASLSAEERATGHRPW